MIYRSSLFFIFCCRKYLTFYVILGIIYTVLSVTDGEALAGGIDRMKQKAYCSFERRPSGHTIIRWVFVCFF